MRWTPLLVVIAACGGPLEAEEPERFAVHAWGTEFQSLKVRLGDTTCSDATCAAVEPSHERPLLLSVSGVTHDGERLRLEQEISLPARGHLAEVKVARTGDVELVLIDEAGQYGVLLDGLTVVNRGEKPVLAYGGCDLHDVKPGASLELDCARDDLVALQQSTQVAPHVTLTTTFGLWLR